MERTAGRRHEWFGSGGAAGDASGEAGTTGFGTAGTTATAPRHHGSGTAGTTGARHRGHHGSGAAGTSGLAGFRRHQHELAAKDNPFPSSCTASADRYAAAGGTRPRGAVRLRLLRPHQVDGWRRDMERHCRPHLVVGHRRRGGGVQRSRRAGGGRRHRQQRGRQDSRRVATDRREVDTRAQDVTATNSVSRFALDKTGALIAVTARWRRLAVDGPRRVLSAEGRQHRRDGTHHRPRRWAGRARRGPQRRATSTPAANPGRLYRSQDNGVTWAYFGLAGTLVGEQPGPERLQGQPAEDRFQSSGGAAGQSELRRELDSAPCQGGGWVQSSTGIDDYSKVHGIVLNPASGVLYAANYKNQREPRAEACSPPRTTGRRGSAFSTGFDTTLRTRGLAIGSDGTLYVLGRGTSLSLWRTTAPCPRSVVFRLPVGAVTLSCSGESSRLYAVLIVSEGDSARLRFASSRAAVAVSGLRSPANSLRGTDRLRRRVERDSRQAGLCRRAPARGDRRAPPRTRWTLLPCAFFIIGAIGALTGSPLLTGRVVSLLRCWA